MWVFAVADFCSNSVMINIVFFLPAIIQDFGVSALTSNLLSSIPYGTAVVVMMAIAIHSDKVNERWLHVTLPCIVALVGLGFLAKSMEANWSVGVKMFFVVICVASVWGFKGPFLAWMTGGLRGSSAVGIAVVNSVANSGGWLGPLVQARTYEETGSYSYGIAYLAGLIVLLIFCVSLLRWWERKSLTRYIHVTESPFLETTKIQ